MFDAGGVVEQAAALVAVDVSTVMPSDLFEVMTTVAAVHSRLELFLARALVELDVADAADALFGLTSSPLLARDAHLPLNVTGRLHRAGRELRGSLPLTEAAVLDGRLTMAHAKFLADLCNDRVDDAICDIEDTLIEAAEGASFEIWCAAVRSMVAEFDEDGVYDPDAELERNRLHVSKLPNGAIKVTAEFVGEHALAVEQALNHKGDELFRQAKTDNDIAGGEITIPRRTTLMALGMAELFREGSAVDLNSTIPPRPEISLIAYADSPTRICDRHGHKLPDGTIITVCCDPDIWGVIANTFGIPLDLGRKRRAATKAQRDAMAIRDGGCTFPGCHAPSAWTDAHHVTHWAWLKGDTDLANLASLCRRHHGVTHRKDWSMKATDDGWFWWTTPEGRTFWSQRHGRQRTGPPPPAPPHTMAA